MADDTIKSIFNTGLKLMDRIDMELTFVSRDSHALKFAEWANDLFVIGREVRHLMDKDQLSLYDNYFLGITNLINNLYNYNPSQESYILKRTANQSYYSNLYKLLIEFDTFIRAVLQDKDLLFANKQNARTAIIN